ncbi:MAG TPA: sulfite exporter TauE/SafE family protein [Acetobacteraceae bacterium]|nr:sulfite exporter TauE/SafE family protein [Acetobacteraceae bacterium]
MHELMHLGGAGLYSLAGLIVGLLVGLTGVGGGSLMTPLLILLFGVHPVTAVGTDLLQAASTKAVGTAVHGLNGTVEWRITARLACGSIPAAAVTILALSVGLHQVGASHAISVLLGVAVILTAVALLFRGPMLRAAAGRTGSLAPRHVARLTVLAGVVLGVLVTITSVGAGALGVVVLAFLYPSLPTARIIAADIAHAVPLTLLAGLGHWWLGTIDWALLGSLLLGSVPGVVVGSLLATRVPDMVLRPVLAAVLLLVGGRLLG